MTPKLSSSWHKGLYTFFLLELTCVWDRTPEEYPLLDRFVALNVVYVCAFLRMLVCMCVGAFVYVFDCVCANVFVLCVCACVCCVCVCPGDELCEVTNTTSNYHKLLDDSAANTVAVHPTTETFSLIPPPANSPGRSSRVMIYCNRTLLFPLHPPPPDSRCLRTHPLSQCPSDPLCPVLETAGSSVVFRVDSGRLMRARKLVHVIKASRPPVASLSSSDRRGAKVPFGRPLGIMILFEGCRICGRCGDSCWGSLLPLSSSFSPPPPFFPSFPVSSYCFVSLFSPMYRLLLRL